MLPTVADSSRPAAYRHRPIRLDKVSSRWYLWIKHESIWGAFVDVLRASAPARERRDGAERITSDVSGQGPLWFEVEAEFAGLLSDRADHVALGLLMPAMKARRDLHVGGTVTDVLLHQINTDLQPLLVAIHGDCAPIHVTADATAPADERRPGVGVGFSGGVDSLAAVRTYFLAEEVPDDLRVTHLLNYNVGSHGPDGQSLWQARCRPLSAAAEAWGLPLVRVDSNLDAHYPRLGFMESVSMRNAAAAHALAGGLGRVHLGSAKSFAHAGTGLHGDIAAADTMLLPLTTTAAMTVSSANSGMSRVEKTLGLVGRPEAVFLDVCTSFNWEGPRNCGQCDKCMRTMLTLEIAGHLSEFTARVFPEQPYREHRDDYIVRMLAADDPFSDELRAFAIAHDWSWGIHHAWKGARRTAASQRRATAASSGTHPRRRLRASPSSALSVLQCRAFFGAERCSTHPSRHANPRRISPGAASA